MLWDYVYKSKFDSERYLAIKFEYYLMLNVDQLALLSPNLKLRSQAVVNVLESQRSAAITKDARCDINNTFLRLPSSRPAEATPGRSHTVDRRPTPHNPPDFCPYGPPSLKCRSRRCMSPTSCSR